MSIWKEYPVLPSPLSTVAQEAFVLECPCPTYILNLLQRRFPLQSCITRNPGFSDLPREKLYTVKPCCLLCPMMVLTCTPSMTHPRPPCKFVLYFTCSTLACSK